VSQLPRGVLPAAVTPFSENGQIDLAGVARRMAWFGAHGCAGVVLAGTNGEGASLSAVEKRDMVRTAVSVAAGMPVILGVATASLDEAVWSCESARKAGAVAALVMPPAFFREATEEGISGWFERLLSETTLPILLYNFPRRTGFTFSPELVARLCSHDGVAGVKDSSGNADNIGVFAQAAAGKSLYNGDESLMLRSLEAGWSGAISGAANLLAPWLVPIFADWFADRESAETKFAYVLPTIRALRESPQPAANKWLLERLGHIDRATPRLPLLPLDEVAGNALWEQVKTTLIP
jgi:4-hydroxy-tetrahydrodipicolinate synthase